MLMFRVFKEDKAFRVIVVVALIALVVKFVIYY